MLLQAFFNLVDNLGQEVRTQLVDGLLALDLLQDVRFLRVYTRIILYIKWTNLYSEIAQRAWKYSHKKRDAKYVN
jgi:hypothetical protein